MLVHAGETQRVSCSDCDAEWDIVFEPKAKGDARAQEEIKPVEVSYCPSCGAALVDED